MKAAVFNANEWLYPDSEGGCGAVRLQCARRSYACCQIKLSEAVPFVWRVQAEGGGGQGPDPELFVLKETYVNRNSSYQEPLDIWQLSQKEAERFFTRRAPFEVYDAMLPVRDGQADVHGDAGLYVRWKTAPDMAPGIYRGTLILGEIQIPYEIHVHKACLPEQTGLALTQWMKLDGKIYGCTPFAGRFWEMVEKTLELAAQAHQNYLLIPVNFIEADGKGGYDFSRVKRLIEMAFSKGFTHIEGMHATSVYNSLIKPFVEADILSEAGMKALGAFFGQWYRFLEREGYLEVTVQHVGDEPRDGEEEAYRKLAGLVRSCMPGIPLLDAVLTDKVGDALDILVPVTRFYQIRREAFDAWRKEGKEMWIYTCCWPGAPCLNRFLDMPLLSVRLLHWLNVKWKASGYLHWGLGHFMENIDPYREPSVPFTCLGTDSDQFLPPGDTNIIYPTPDGPVGSVRLEMLRSGVEDYALFRMLEEKAEGKAEEILGMCVKEDGTGIYGNTHFEKVYGLLLDAADRAWG